MFYPTETKITYSLKFNKKLSTGKNKKITCCNNSFNPKKKFTKKQLIVKIKEIHNKRLNYDDMDEEESE